MKHNFSAKEITKIGMLTAAGVLLPMIFHIFGQALGYAMLPMHIPVLIAGLVLDPLGALIVGVLSPILSFLITGMPPVPMVFFMVFELATYGFIMSVLIKKFNIIISLIGAMICGRIVSGIAVFIATALFGVKFSAPIPFVIASVTGAIPGIILQLIIIPIIYGVLKKRGITNESK